jgi:hypothetical protein
LQLENAVDDDAEAGDVPGGYVIAYSLKD